VCRASTLARLYPAWEEICSISLRTFSMMGYGVPTSRDMIMNWYAHPKVRTLKSLVGVGASKVQRLGILSGRFHSAVNKCQRIEMRSGRSGTFQGAVASVIRRVIKGDLVRSMGRRRRRLRIVQTDRERTNEGLGVMPCVDWRTLTSGVTVTGCKYLFYEVEEGG
jgi:hypothetical protein